MKSSLIVLHAFLGIACSTSGEPARSRESREPWAAPARVTPPGDLPPAAREVLRTVMAQHGRDMSDLILAAVAVDYDASALAADRIRSDAFARPLTGDATELNALLPARFFELQDELQTRSRAMAAAARRRDPIAVAREYAALSETCVTCHAVYREGRAAPSAALHGAREERR